LFDFRLLQQNPSNSEHSAKAANPARGLFRWCQELPRIALNFHPPFLHRQSARNQHKLSRLGTLDTRMERLSRGDRALVTLGLVGTGVVLAGWYWLYRVGW
jgi:hypothetical protein